jgi:peptide/nickel transport system substrate-binding protein
VAEAKPTLLRIGSWTPIQTFSPRFTGTATDQVINGYLVQTDERWVLQPQLAERVPSQDDGTWIVNPDGTMRTIWTLKAGARWQDGQPLTAHDVAFGHRVHRDRDLPVETDLPERYISSVVPRDDRTFEVHWDRLYYPAGQPDARDLTPLPRHLLEDLYASGDKQAFANSTFWTSEQYVGAGPYRVVHNEPGEILRVAANPHFILGRPKIDTIEFLTIQDRNALVARMLSGDLQYVEHTTIQAEHAAILQEQWKITGEGRIATTPWTPFPLRFQHKEVPNHQAALKDIRVRQALIHAIDRDALAASETAGLAPAADSFVPPNQAVFPRIDAVIAKYPYNPQRAAQLLVEAGWTKGGDGRLRNTDGQIFDIEVFSTIAAAKTATIVADYWKQAGMDSRLFTLSQSQTNDRQLRAVFPGVDVSSGGQQGDNLYPSYSTADIAGDQNQWRGRNITGWSDPEYDGLVARLERSLVPSERDELTVQLERLMTVTVANGKLYYAARPMAARNNVQGPKGFNALSTNVFNIHEWELK